MYRILAEVSKVETVKDQATGQQYQLVDLKQRDGKYDLVMDWEYKIIHNKEPQRGDV